MYRDKNDETLVELTLLGQDEAYAELVTRYTQAVRGTVYKVQWDPWLAEDAAQEAFLAAWMQLDTLRDRTQFRSWVCAAAKRFALRTVANRETDVRFEALEHADVFGEEDRSVSTFAESEDLRAAVARLPETVRDTISLHYFRDLTVEEIAALRALPVGTVKWRLSEGRKLLRKEFGVMESKTLTQRVMEQVEQLKLWRLKEDRTGFAEAYRKTLELAETMDASKEKHHALADILIHGYWWLDEVRNEDTVEQIRRHALESHNEDVMESLASIDAANYKDEALIAYRRDVQIPYYEEHGFVQACGYTRFWLAYDLLQNGRREEALELFRKVRDTLPPDAVYHANAISALEVESYRDGLTGTDFYRADVCATGEVLRQIGSKLYFWSQPGYGGTVLCGSLLWNLSGCNSLLFDTDMQVGDVYTAENGTNTLTYERDGETVVTPAGTFENCAVFHFRGNHYGISEAETAFCPGVGLVRQTVRYWAGETEWVLSSYTVNGGNGFLPAVAGNVWEYKAVMNCDLHYDTCVRMAVTYADRDRIVLAKSDRCRRVGHEDTWQGNLLAAETDTLYWDERNNEHFSDVSALYVRAVELASTEREKVCATAEQRLYEQVKACDAALTPDSTVLNCWNRFDASDMTEDGGTVKMKTVKHFGYGDLGARYDDANFGLLYNLFHVCLFERMGCIWSDAWVPGYHEERQIPFRKETFQLTFDVGDEETVVTPAGTFENCRHVTMFVFGGPKSVIGFRGGKKEYWFAPDIGIVKFVGHYRNAELESLWRLTEMQGTGKGYFPAENGMYRRYEAMELTEGYHGASEWHYVCDEKGKTVYAVGLATQDRK